MILIGNLGADPESRVTADNTLIVNIRLATSRKWKDRATGELKEQTEWHRVVFFNKLAETVETYLGKGSQVYLEGRIQSSKWKDKENQDRYTTEIVAEQLSMLGKKSEQGTKNKMAIAPSHAGLRNFERGEPIDIDDLPF